MVTSENLKKKDVNEGKEEESPVGREEKRSHLFQPGQRGGPGRAKGQQNKVTKTIKEAVLEAVQPGQCHPEGLVGWLRDRANGGIEDRKLFCAMVSRVIPVEVTGANGGPVKIDLGWLTGRNIGGQDAIDVTPTSHDEEDGKQINRLGMDVPDYQSDEGEDHGND